MAACSRAVLARARARTAAARVGAARRLRARAAAPGLPPLAAATGKAVSGAYAAAAAAAEAKAAAAGPLDVLEGLLVGLANRAEQMLIALANGAAALVVALWEMTWGELCTLLGAMVAASLALRALDGALRARRGGAANSEATTGAATGAQIGIGSDEASAPASIAAEAKPKTVAAAGDYSAKVEAESAASRRVFDTSAGVDFNAEKETVNGAPPRDFLDVDGLKDNSEATDDAPDGGDIEGTRRLLENIRGVEAKRGTSGGAGGSYEPPEEIEATRVPFDNGPVDSELLASDLAGPRKLPASGLYLPKADPRKEIFDTEHPHPVESDSSESEEERQSTGGWGLRGALSRLLRRKSFDVPTPPSELESEFSSEPAPSAPPAAADREEAAAPPAVGVAAATSPTNSTKKRVRSLPRPRSVYPEDGYVRRATTLGAKPGAVGVLSLLAVETAVGVARVAITAALAAANGSEEVKPSRGPAADPQMDEAKNKAP